MADELDEDQILAQLACQHPDRVSARTIADPADVWYCPSCGAKWQGGAVTA